MTLKRLYESCFGFRYDEMDKRPFNSGNYHQWRDLTLSDLPLNISIRGVIVYLGMTPSNSEAKRLLKSGGIRVGTASYNTNIKDCKKLTEDRPLEPNDLIRVGVKSLWIRPPKPRIMDELSYAWEKIMEKLTRMPSPS